MCQVRTFLFSLSLLLVVGTSTAQSITVLTHDSFSFPLELVERFTADTGIEVDFLSGGDAGQVVNRAILTKARPIADLLFGVDETLLERARDEQIFEPYESPELRRVPRDLWLDPAGLVTPIDVGYVTVNLDTAWFEERSLKPPVSLAELTAERYAGTLVALVHDEEDMLPAVVRCDTNREHAWTPGEWPALGRKLGRTSQAGALALVNAIAGRSLLRHQVG